MSTKSLGQKIIILNSTFNHRCITSSLTKTYLCDNLRKPVLSWTTTASVKSVVAVTLFLLYFPKQSVNRVLNSLRFDSLKTYEHRSAPTDIPAPEVDPCQIIHFEVCCMSTSIIKVVFNKSTYLCWCWSSCVCAPELGARLSAERPGSAGSP